jgi:hypothetical protein
MGRRGTLNVEKASTAQRRNTPQGVHPASHLRTGGWGVKGTRSFEIEVRRFRATAPASAEVEMRGPSPNLSE